MANEKTAALLPLVAFLGGEHVVGKTRSSDVLEARIKRGLPFRALETLMESARLSREQAMRLFGVPARTLARRKQAGTLTFEETDRLVQFADLFAFAVRVLGTKDGAASWLHAPNPYLGGVAPMERLDNVLGRNAVLEELNRIAYGMLA
jgi:putative toxin-antitoxin system antitoxin component (TIGR02293 family)